MIQILGRSTASVAKSARRVAVGSAAVAPHSILVLNLVLLLHCFTAADADAAAEADGR